MAKQECANDSATDTHTHYSSESTFEILEKKYVFVVDKDKVVHQRENYDCANADLYIIKEGLSENERIYLKYPKVKGNDKLEV